jgi:hypothetical protein
MLNHHATDTYHHAADERLDDFLSQQRRLTVNAGHDVGHVETEERAGRAQDVFDVAARFDVTRS